MAASQNIKEPALDAVEAMTEFQFLGSELALPQEWRELMAEPLAHGAGGGNVAGGDYANLAARAREDDA
jgi:hypothetical protein